MPKPKKKPVKKDWNPSPRIRAFLAAYQATASITRAAAAAGIRREAHYRLLERSADYRAAFAFATRVAADALEDEAIRRAKDGLLKPKFYHGDLILVSKNPSDPKCKERVPYMEAEHSDALLQTLLRRFKPDEYRDRVEHGVTDKLGEALKFRGTFQDLLAHYHNLTTASDGDDE